MIVGDAFANQKEIFAATGAAPKTVVFMHINDTFGTAIARAVGAGHAEIRHAVHDRREIAYDPAARDLSVEVAKAKATNADALLVVSRLNDAMLMTRELVKQRWTPQAILSMGPGWYEDQYLKTLGKLADGPISFVPWYDPHKRLTPVLEAALAKADPGVNLNTNHVFTFEALLGRRRRLQARRFDRSEGAGRRHPHHQHHRQCQHRTGHRSSTPRGRTTR